MLLLHAIVPVDTVAPPAVGVRGWPLRAARAAGLVGWASEWRPDAPPLGRDDLLAHHALATQALGVCLPVRLPTWLADDTALGELLAARQAELLAALERVRGTAELAVTATWQGVPPPGVPSPASTPGRRYLEERRRQFATDDQRRVIAQQLAARIGGLPHVLKAQHRVCPSAAIALSSALLVPLDAAAELRAALPAGPHNVRILVNGPWPPYSFSELV